MNIVLFGAPAAGKGTQARILTSEYGFIQLSTGDILRSISKSDTDLAKKILSILKNGGLVSDEIVTELIEKKIKAFGSTKDYIFDGFPRTLSQAEALDRILMLYHQKIDEVIYLSVDNEVLIKRIQKRYQEEQRSDDNPEAFKVRLSNYEDQTRPLLEHYQEQNKLSVIDGMLDIDTVSLKIAEVLALDNAMKVRKC